MTTKLFVAAHTLRAVNSEAQKAAARANGRKGGRPRTLGAVIAKLEAYQNQRGCPLDDQQQRQVNEIKSKLIEIMDEVGE